MKQNRYFNLGRFARLFKHDVLLNNKTYLFAVTGLGIAIYAFIFLIMYLNRRGFNSTQAYIPLFLLYLMGMGVIIGTSFPAFNNQIRTSNYLLAPGSTFEKFLIQFIIRIVLFIPLSLGLFWIGANLAKASLVPDLRIGFDPSKIPAFTYGDIFEDVSKLRDKVVIIISVFSTASILLAGSAYFNRFALVKTLITIAVGIGAVVLSFVLFSHIFYPEVTSGFDIHVPSYKIAEDMETVQLFFYLLGSLSWLFFLPLAYFKLKEKEV